MGCDIHCYGEKRYPYDYTREYIDEFFAWRSYGLYGFLANIRNYSAITPFPLCHEGLPMFLSTRVERENS